MSSLKRHYWLSLITGVLLVGVVLFVIASCGGETAVPPTEAEAVEAPSAPAQAAETPIPETEAEPESVPDAEPDQIPMGFTAEGYPYRGAADAPITISEFSDFQCPFCARHVDQTEPHLLEQYVADGQVRIVFRDFPIANLHPQAYTAHQAAHCAGEQDIAHFWAMHHQLFAAQSEWGASGNPAGLFRGYAEELGLDVAAFSACMGEGRHDHLIDAGLADGEAAGVSGTPSFLINGHLLVGAQPFEQFQVTIDAIARGEDPPAEPAQQAEPPDLPLWATEEGLGVDPERPGYTVAGDATLGSSDAPIVILEASDFQCPYCRRHAATVEPDLMEAYVEPGHVRLVLKHLLGYNRSQVTAEAAECAGLQGRFWEMHHRIFEDVSWQSGDAGEVLKGFAAELGMDTDAFNACLDEGHTRDHVLEQHNSLRTTGIQGTPSFIIFGVGDQPILVPGLIGFEQWEEFLDEVLEGMGR